MFIFTPIFPTVAICIVAVTLATGRPPLLRAREPSLRIHRRRSCTPRRPRRAATTAAIHSPKRARLQLLLLPLPLSHLSSRRRSPSGIAAPADGAVMDAQ